MTEHQHSSSYVARTGVLDRPLVFPTLRPLDGQSSNRANTRAAPAIEPSLLDLNSIRVPRACLASLLAGLPARPAKA